MIYEVYRFDVNAHRDTLGYFSTFKKAMGYVELNSNEDDKWEIESYELDVPLDCQY